MIKIIVQTEYDDTRYKRIVGLSVKNFETNAMIYGVGFPLTDRYSMGYPTPFTLLINWLEKNREYVMVKSQDCIKTVNTVTKEVTVRIENEKMV